jgi:hypothetical protein
MMPEFPIAKQKILESQGLFFEFAQKQKLGPLFADIPKQALPEGNRMKQEYSKTMVHESGMTAIKSHFQINIAQAKADPFIIYEQLVQTAADFADQQTLMTLKGISEITELTGNVVGSRNGFTTEQFFECIEKVEIEFDKQGNPRLPTIVASLLKAGEHLPENKGRMEAIINTKRKKWYDRENNRKLVD